MTYYVNYYEIIDNKAIQHTMVLNDEDSDLEALKSTISLLNSKAEYMDVLTDTFTIYTDEEVIVAFLDGRTF